MQITAHARVSQTGSAFFIILICIDFSLEFVYSQQRLSAVAAVKSPRVHISVVLFLVTPIHLVLGTAQAGARGVRDVAIFHYLS